MADYNPLEETMTSARAMLQERRKAAEEALKPRRKENVLKDILPPGMTLKRLQEIVRR
jgi:hypothetical protein